MFHHNKMRRFLAKLQFRRNGMYFFNDLALPLPVNIAKIPHRCLNWSKPWEKPRRAIISKKRDERPNAHLMAYGKPPTEGLTWPEMKGFRAT